MYKAMMAKVNKRTRATVIVIRWFHAQGNNSSNTNAAAKATKLADRATMQLAIVTMTKVKMAKREGTASVTTMVVVPRWETIMEYIAAAPS